MTTPKLHAIDINKIVESPWNPRKHFDPIAQKNLEESMRVHDQLVPGTVRPSAGGKFELAAGTRRYRAAKALKLATYLAIVRELNDAEFCEILTIDNDERSDVHPLEQANGYKLLMEKSGYTVAKIAERIQRDHTFVYDRLRLLQLTPALKEHFIEGHFGLSQALVLAKLSADEQAKIAKQPTRYDGSDSGLWRSSEPTLDKTVFPLVAKTAAELEAWIASHLRFNEEKVLLGEVFEDTAIALEAAEETGVRVVGITYSDYLPQSIERDPTDKIFTAKFWKRADGLEGSRACDYVVVGVVKAGKGRGGSIGVCTSRDTCTVHWASRVKELEKRKKESRARATGGAKSSPAAKAKKEVRLAQQAKREAAAALRENVTKSKTVAAVTLIEAELDAIVKKATPAMVKHAREALGGKDRDGLTLEQLVVKLAIEAKVRDDLVYSLTDSYSKGQTVKILKGWGIDVAKVIAGVKVETCVHCGCSEENGCRLGNWGAGPTCKWVSTSPRVCSKPSCVAAWKGTPVAVKDAAAAVIDEFLEGDDDED